MARDFAWLKDALARQAKDLVAAWLPGGQPSGNEWVCGGVDGAPGRSLSVNLTSGVWADFSADLKGGDLISLAAAIRGCSQAEAFDRLVDELRLTPPDAGGRPAPARAPERGQMVPAPTTASDPIPATKTPPPWSRLTKDGARWVATWIYRDAAGSVLQAVARYRMPDGSKTIQPWTWCEQRDGSWCWTEKGPPRPRPLYGLDRLAARPDAPVLIVEGEATADAAQRLADAAGDPTVVISWATGTKGVAHADWRPLAGRRCVAWPDADRDHRGPDGELLPYASQPGPAAVERLRDLLPADADLVIVDVAGVPVGAKDGWDLADAEQLGWTWATVQAWIEEHGRPARSAPREAPAAPGKGGEADGHGPAARPARAQRPAGVGSFGRLVESWRGFVGRLGLWPDAMYGWRDQHGQSADTGDGDLQLRWTYELYSDDNQPKDAEIRTCCQVEIADRRAERRAALVGGLIGRPSTDAGRAALATMARAWLGRDDPLMTAVIGQWIWQVKRRAAGMPVEWDLMPVLVGPQGGGKTTAIAILAAPWAELAVPLTAHQITDQREAPTLAKALVGIWDEMTGANKADTEALKRAITASQMAWRALYSHAFETRRRTITFFGSSNLPISMVVRDTTGARRFAELRVGILDWDTINGLDHRLVWEAVSEADPAPILPHMQALRDHQRSLIHQDVVSAWLQHEADDGFGKLVCIRPDASDPDIVPPLDGTDGDPGGWTLHQIGLRLAFYGRPLGSGRVDLSTLPARLRQLGWVDRRVRVGDWRGNRREYRWFLDPAARAQLLADEHGQADAAADLRAQLVRAIAQEDYERAAALRDQIKTIERAGPGPRSPADAAAATPLDVATPDQEGETYAPPF